MTSGTVTDLAQFRELRATRRQAVESEQQYFRNIRGLIGMVLLASIAFYGALICLICGWV